MPGPSNGSPCAERLQDALARAQFDEVFWSGAALADGEGPEAAAAALTVSAAAQHLGLWDEAWRLAAQWACAGAHVATGPLVTVVIPTRNRPQLLERALASVAAQLYRPLQVVVVNDAGEPVDAVLDLFRDQLEIELVDNERNVYLAASRNAGLARARGHYVALLDDDDQLYPHHVGHLVALLAASGAHAAHALTHMHAADAASPTGEALRPLPLEPFAWPVLLTRNVVPVQCLLFERALLDALGGFDTTLRANEDWEFWIRLRQLTSVEQSDVVTSCVDLHDHGNARMSRRLAPFHAAHREIFARSHALAVAAGGPALLARQRDVLRDIARRLHEQVQRERVLRVIAWGPGPVPDVPGVDMIPLPEIDGPTHANAWRTAAEGADYLAFVEATRLPLLPHGWLAGLAAQLELETNAAAAAPSDRPFADDADVLLPGRDVNGLDPVCVVLRAATVRELPFDARLDAGAQWLDWFARTTARGLTLRLADHVTWDRAAFAPAVAPPAFPPQFVLCWHRVLPSIGHDPFGLAVTQERFEEQLDALASWCRFIEPAELGRAPKDGDPRPRVLVTFDDGYRDNYEYAFPVLEKRGIPALLFVATGAVEGDAPFWWEALARAARRHGADTSTAQQEWRFLAPAQRAECVATASALLDDHDQHELSSLALDWKELRELHAGGRVTLGAHTHAHSSLGRLRGAELREEIVRSRTLLEWHTGCAPAFFAFPHGGPDDVSDVAIEELAACGFHFAFTTVQGAVTAPLAPGSAEALRVPRLVVGSDESGAALSARLTALTGGAALTIDAPDRRPARAIAVLSGISASNLGDDAMLIATVQELRRLDPHAEIRVLAEDPAACGPVQRLAGVPILTSPQKLIQRLVAHVPADEDPAVHVLRLARDVLRAREAIVRGARPDGLDAAEVEGLRWLLAADGVIDCGGANLDAHWKSYFYEKCFDYLVAAKPLLVEGQGIDRFVREEDRALLRAALDRADAVTVRERISERHLREVGVAAPIATTGDDALDLEPASPERAAQVLARLGVDASRPFVAFQYRHYLEYRDEQTLDRFAAIVAAVHDATGLPVVGIPMHFGGTDERDHLRAVAARVRPPGALRVIVEELDAVDAKALVAASTALFGISYHSAIFALSTGVPFAGLYRGAHYAQKMRGLADLYRLPDLAFGLDEIPPESFGMHVARLVAERPARRAALLERHAALSGAVRETRRAFVDAVRRRAEEREESRAATPPATTTVPAAGRLNWGDLRRLEPVSAEWGFDRGLPVDRVYIEGFLEQHAADVRGRVCELLNDDYTCRYGGARVTERHVLDIDGANARATIVDDLAAPRRLGQERFDCFILTQTLPYIFDCGAALRAAYAALRPGGVLLVTVPSIIRYHREPEDHWRFTTDSLARLIETRCPGASFDVRARGNLLAAVGFLYGMAATDLSPEELAHDDERFPVVITARIVKGEVIR